MVTRGEPDAQAIGASLKDGLGGDITYSFLGSSGYTTNAIQAGSLGLGTGSTGWAIYPKAFAGSPMVVAIYANLGSNAYMPSGIPAVCGSVAGPGSVMLIGELASLDVHWFAFGTY
jgi:hypothetical protein